ncbi:acyl transferase domain-containing protein [Aspergillus pseudonomiae]|nr:acyl transferase domain-containing protein [Aspergillus pseudonomiae]
MGSIGREHESIPIQAAQRGAARICAAFGGQGSNNLDVLKSLLELYKRYGPDLDELLDLASNTLSQLASSPEAIAVHEPWGFDLRQWLATPEVAPSKEVLALSPRSFPLNTLISLALYCATCRELELDPGQLRSLLHSATGHSQGILAAVAITQAESWSTFYDACRTVLLISFWIGLEAYLSTPSYAVSDTMIQDCIEHGEGLLSSMLSISGLSRPQVEGVIEHVNKALGECNQWVHLALVNSHEKFVLAGPPQSLWAVCLYVRRIRADNGLDQSRILFCNRKPTVDLLFLPISAPFHTPYLDGVQARVLEALSSVPLPLHSMKTPLYHTGTGSNLQELQTDQLIPTLIHAITVDQLNWPLVCRGLNATHVLDFGPGQTCSLINELTRGTGVSVIQLTSQSGPKPVGGHADAVNWEAEFGLQLRTDVDGTAKLHNRMTTLLGKPPVMVAGMTPTTVRWDFVAAVAQAGYHVELAGGGYYTERQFETEIRRLATAIPADCGITCNILYAKPTTFSWQISVIKDLVRQGVPMEGITIGAGIPSPEVVQECVQSIGLKHISFKPGSIEAIHQVIQIARTYPDFLIGLQWTAGRGGGHHSWEDFHAPILVTYAQIRSCPNILLIAGSGFGGGPDTFPYLTGQWAQAFGYPCMPFDGVLLGSRMMVAREAHTSAQAKRLIMDAEGVEDGDWHKSFREPTGGVVTVNSEFGQPIHVLATRGVMLWKELDNRVFSIKDTSKRLEYLRNHRQEIASRLNQDFARPWFAVDGHGQNVELEDMTYLEVLRRLCDLTYVSHQKRWVDLSYRVLVLDFVHLLRERFQCAIDNPGEQPLDIIARVEESLKDKAYRTLYPEDISLLMQLFSRRDIKPVPFIPRLDERFETWFKKDSLWQSEDVEAVIGQDAHRIFIIQGPMAAQYSTSDNESVKDILDKICNHYVGALQADSRQSSIGDGHSITQKSPLSAFPGLSVTTNRVRGLYKLEKVGAVPEMDVLFEHVVGLSRSWARTCLMSKSVSRDGSRLPNPIRAALQAQRGDTIEVLYTEDSEIRKIRLISPTGDGGSTSQVVFEIVSDDGKRVFTTLAPNVPSNPEPTVAFCFKVDQKPKEWTLEEDTSGRAERIKALYMSLWNLGSPNKGSLLGLNSQFTGEELVITTDKIRDFERVLRQTSPLQLQSWNPQGCVPIDYCVVIAWSALTKPLMVSALKCDFLDLLHSAISFHYAPSVKPLRVGDIVKTSSRILAVAVKPRGTMLTVSADIQRQGQHVVTVKSDFFVGGTVPACETPFELTEEPEMVVHVDSEVRRAILNSRKWLMREDRAVDLLGKQLLFRLKSEKLFQQNGQLALLQVTGFVFTYSSDGSTTPFGRVYFESESCIGNVVMDFLHRHGAPRAQLLELEHPGWTGTSTVAVQAPRRSQSYARVSLDHNPIHVCPAFARYAGLSGPIVHGMETSAMMRRIAEWAVGDADRSRFRSWRITLQAPIHPNDPLRVELQHRAMEDGEMVLKVQAFNERTEECVAEADAHAEQETTAYVFCGQGSQQQGMGMELYSNCAEAKALWTRADTHLWENYGFSILHIVQHNPLTLTVHFGGPRGRRVRANYLRLMGQSPIDGQHPPILKGLAANSTSYTFSYSQGLLMSTQFAQPALALMEMAQFEWLKAQGVIQKGARFAGHSLGEYAALGACASFLSFEDLISLIFYRGLKMQNALPRDANGHTDYGMLAADPSRIGKGFEEASLKGLVHIIHQETGWFVEVVNYNIYSQQYVCAGHFRALWTLGRLCDDLSCHPRPEAIEDQELRAMVWKHVPTVERVSREDRMERGRATIPLPGIDIPYHSTLLRGEIEPYREYLSERIRVADVKPCELVGRWIPNVVGQPFSVDKSYVQLVHDITGSPRLHSLLQQMA